MLISQLSTYWQQIEQVSSRLEMTDILVKMLESADPDESQLITYLCLGRLGSRYDNTEFNLAAKSMLKVIAQWGSLPIEDVQDLYKQTGDIGDLVFTLASEGKLSTIEAPHSDETTTSAESTLQISKDSAQALRVDQDDASPSVTSVYDTLLCIATLSGTGSQDQKVTAMVQILSSLDPLSAKFIARLPIGKLRLGFSDMTILDTLSFLVAGDKSLRSDLESAYNVAADVGLLVKNIKTWLADGLPPTDIQTKLQSQQVVWGTPVVAALCQRLKTFDEIIDKMGTVAIEPKYDGTRVQIHFKKVKRKKNKENAVITRENENMANIGTRRSRSNSVQPTLLADSPGLPSQAKNDTTTHASSNSLLKIKTFTRNLEENSAMFPELLTIADQINSDAVVLDCEAVGYDPDTDKILPFQTTIQRKRKYGVDQASQDIPLRFMIFDVLFTSEQGTVMGQPFEQRRALLQSLINDNKTIQVIELETTDDPGVLRQKHRQYLDAGLEGAIIKKWDSPYTPGRKGWHWVKMKHVETADAMLSDTIDGVVMGYYHGRGKRAALGMGAFLIGVRATGSGKLETRYLTVSKIGTGMTDDQITELVSLFKPDIVSTKPVEYSVSKDLIPDLWLNPSIVVEVAADEITESKMHTSGYGLRFPRLLKVRDDKDATQATSLDELKTIR